MNSVGFLLELIEDGVSLVRLLTSGGTKIAPEEVRAELRAMAVKLEGKIGELDARIRQNDAEIDKDMGGGEKAP